MKLLKHLMLVMCFIALTGCDLIKPDPTPNTLNNTVWVYTDRYVDEDEDGTVTDEYKLEFFAGTAVYSNTLTLETGNETYTEESRYDYRYTYSDNLVVLKPVDPNMYHLEGVVTAGIKMVVSNSEGEVIGTFYRE